MKNAIYQSLKFYCRAALWFYFKKWQVAKKHSDIDGPVIFVVNHQNAFLDAIILGASSHRNPWFLTRANVFQKDFVKKIFNTFRMTPVYRFRDGFSTLRKNDEVISNCIQLLEKGEAIAIFGEGNHDEHWRLRPLQKGFARIAVAAEEKNNRTLGVKIIPVGIQYDSHTKFRSRVLVSFGEPILVNNAIREATTLPDQLELLIDTVTESLRPLMLNMEQPDYENKVLYFLNNRILKKDLVEQLKSDQHIISTIPVSPEARVLKKEMREQPWWKPFFIYEFINHFFPRYIIRWVVQTKIKDPQFIGSIKFALGMVITPVFYLLQTGLCYFISNSPLIAGAYFISLPISILLKD